MLNTFVIENVIASVAKQSITLETQWDCFVVQLLAMTGIIKKLFCNQSISACNVIVIVFTAYSW